MKKRRQTNLERLRAIKSDLYVHDSDDASDEEKDRLFYDREAQLRREHSRKVLEAMRLGAENGGNSHTGSKSKARKRKSSGEDPSATTRELMNKTKRKDA